jgi:hypothetical protein
MALVVEKLQKHGRVWRNWRFGSIGGSVVDYVNLRRFRNNATLDMQIVVHRSSGHPSHIWSISHICAFRMILARVIHMPPTLKNYLRIGSSY